MVLARLDGLRKQREMLNVPEWSGSEKELREMIKEVRYHKLYRKLNGYGNTVVCGRVKYETNDQTGTVGYCSWGIRYSEILGG